MKVLGLIAGGIILFIASLLVAGANPVTAVSQLITGSVGSASAVSGTIREMTPLLILGVSVFLALKAGLFNIGAEGQFVIGSCFSAATMLAIGGPLGVVVGVLIGAIAGGLWALPAGYVKAFRNGHEVITTIMLNNIAINLTKWLASGPFKGEKAVSASTATLPIQSQLTPLIKVGQFELPQAVVVGILLTLGVGYWLSKTTSGYELRAVGANPTAAEFAGVKTKQVTVKAMFLSGAIAGIAGALQIAQFEHRFYDGSSIGYGFDALGVALLAGGNAFGLFASSFIFGALNKGGTSLMGLGIDKGITTMVLAIVIIIFAAVKYRQKGGQHD
ncbi:MAG: ABC transporter permease [Fimbriimonas sp.]|nr:ABC transporter permease [Fimbriimonas sp.]